MSDMTPLSADDPVLTTVALIRAVLDDDAETFLQLWDGTEDKEAVVTMLAGHAAAASATLSELLHVDPRLLLDQMIRERLDDEPEDPR